jgi:pseudouridine synthase
MEERLQKVLARIYGISRRHAEEMIAGGEVCINGDVAQLGCKVDCEKDTLVVGHRKLSPQLLQVQFTQEVWMLFKPKGVTCTHDDPFAKNTLLPYVPKSLRRQKWVFVGRLDRDSEGLLLLTNDGDFANKVAHPSSGIEKVYRVHLDKALEPNLIQGLKTGRECQGEFLQFKEVKIVNSHKIDVTLQQGKKREIRRLLFSFGYEVLKLKRWKIGELVLDKKLMPGQSRRLSVKEINLIFEKKC